MTGPAAAQTPARWLAASVDLLTLAGIASVVWLPNAALPVLAGLVFNADAFFHWDHFLVAPMLAWRSGMALGSEVYSQYGLGWPVVVGLLGDVLLVSHQAILRLAVLYACIYFAGLYALLRSACSNPLLAAAGVVLALGTTLHSPLFVESGAVSIWQWPSGSPLRSPLDVFFLFALLQHARGGRPGWSIAAGALVGMGLFLETDSGLLLACTFAIYGSCLVLSDQRVSRPFSTAALSVLTGVALLAAGLVLASQGSLLRDPGAMLSGWVGGVANSAAGGAWALPFTVFLRDDSRWLPWLGASLGACLLAVGYTASCLLHGRLTPLALLAGCTGAYGLGRFTLFAWRSHPARLVDVAVPVAILATLALAGAWRALGSGLERKGAGAGSTALARVHRWAPAALLAGLCAWLMLSPGFRSYPNLWSGAGAPPDGAYLVPERGEVLATTPRDRLRFRMLRRTAKRVREIAESGTGVAVIDTFQTWIHLEAGVPPWPGGASPFMNTWTLAQQAALGARLEAEGPDAVLIRQRETVDPKLLDTWQALRDALERRYDLAERVGVYELWRAKAG